MAIWNTQFSITWKDGKYLVMWMKNVLQNVLQLATCTSRWLHSTGLDQSLLDSGVKPWCLKGLKFQFSSLTVHTRLVYVCIKVVDEEQTFNICSSTHTHTHTHLCINWNTDTDTQTQTRRYKIQLWDISVNRWKLKIKKKYWLVALHLEHVILCMSWNQSSVGKQSTQKAISSAM